MSRGIPCTWMRGGTSKGAFFVADDLPRDSGERNAMLLRIMGSPDPRQIDGIGGADPLTSKVAVVARSERPGVDVDYLFLQVFVDRPLVTDRQNCGNLLSGVAQFAIERGLAQAGPDRTELTVFLQNSGQIAEVTIDTPNGQVTYAGRARISGVPGTGAPVLQNFPDAAGSLCGELLPTGQGADRIDGFWVTCIDNGMPAVVLSADALGIRGDESRGELEANTRLRDQLESIRLQAGPKMNLGNVQDLSVPKMVLVASPKQGGTLCTRTFIPHRCHASIGVFGAISVATACLLDEGPARHVARWPAPVDQADTRVSLEHPSGETTVMMQVQRSGHEIRVQRAAILRTARKLFEGRVFA